MLAGDSTVITLADSAKIKRNDPDNLGPQDVEHLPQPRGATGGLGEYLSPTVIANGLTSAKAVPAQKDSGIESVLMKI